MKEFHTSTPDYYVAQGRALNRLNDVTFELIRRYSTASVVIDYSKQMPPEILFDNAPPADVKAQQKRQNLLIHRARASIARAEHLDSQEQLEQEFKELRQTYVLETDETIKNRITYFSSIPPSKALTELAVLESNEEMVLLEQARLFSKNAQPYAQLTSIGLVDDKTLETLTIMCIEDRPVHAERVVKMAIDELGERVLSEFHDSHFYRTAHTLVCGHVKPQDLDNELDAVFTYHQSTTPLPVLEKLRQDMRARAIIEYENKTLATQFATNNRPTGEELNNVIDTLEAL